MKLLSLLITVGSLNSARKSSFNLLTYFWLLSTSETLWLLAAIFPFLAMLAFLLDISLDTYVVSIELKAFLDLSSPPFLDV